MKPTAIFSLDLIGIETVDRSHQERRRQSLAGPMRPGTV
jgi:hypothetical protein